MRKGKNPAKLEGENKNEQNNFHQIIVPVYLPELKGYYEHGLEILKLCVKSIYLTVHNKTFISVINNGSCKAVREYLDQCLKEDKIHEIIHTSSIGKINAIAKGLSGHEFDLVTITDADVLFTNGWQEAVYDIYKTFPKAGMVGTTPNSKMLKHYTENVHFDNLLNKNFKFREVKNPDDMLSFGKSIENESIFNRVNLKNILTIKQNDTIAVIGSGHFSGTYKSFLLKEMCSKFENHKISAASDKNHLDKPSTKNGHWRLCTYENYTYHLGNTAEKWMQAKFEKILKSKLILDKEPEFEKKYSTCLLCKAKQLLIRRIFFNRYLLKYYYMYLGLSKIDAKSF